MGGEGIYSIAPSLETRLRVLYSRLSCAPTPQQNLLNKGTNRVRVGYWEAAVGGDRNRLGIV